MDTRVHRMEFKEDVYSEELKYVKEQDNLNGFQRRVAVDKMLSAAEGIGFYTVIKAEVGR